MNAEAAEAVRDEVVVGAMAALEERAVEAEQQAGRYETDTPALQREYHRAWARLGKVFAKAGADAPMSEAEQALWADVNVAYHRLTRAVDAAAQMRRRAAYLRSDVERDRLVGVRRRLNEVRGRTANGNGNGSDASPQVTADPPAPKRTVNTSHAEETAGEASLAILAELLSRFEAGHAGVVAERNSKVGFTTVRVNDVLIAYLWTTKAKPVLRVEVAIDPASLPGFEPCKRSPRIRAKTQIDGTDAGYVRAVEALTLALTSS